ncbi:MAG: glycosyltransferase [Clostridiales Family XIII bacterium]|jgi:hypothetical protein|nr:glycosyltransferase [Clostridiales Family XIII bacterium]
MAKFSVLIPVYNGGDHFRETVDSVINQTFADIEVVISDDASTDKSASIIKEYAEKDKRVVPIFMERNMGTAAVRSHLVSKATGDYCIFVDADDELVIDACEVLSDVIVSIDADIIQFGENVINSSDLPEESIKWFVDYIKPLQERLISDDLLHLCFAERKFAWNLHGKVFKTDLLKKAYDNIGDDRVISCEDIYGMFYILFYARSYQGIDYSPLYNYNYGRGANGQKTVSLQRYQNVCYQATISEKHEEFAERMGVTAWLKDILELNREMFVHGGVECWLSFSEKDRIARLPILLDAWEPDLVINKLATKYIKPYESEISFLKETIANLENRVDEVQAEHDNVAAMLNSVWNSRWHKLGVKLKKLIPTTQP